MSGRLLLFRTRWEPREWPRYREGAKADERLWIKSLNDRELAKLAAELGAVEKAVKNFHKQKKDAA